MGVRTESAAENRAVPFTDGLCVTASDVSFEGISRGYAEAGAMMDLSAGNVLLAKHVHERLYLASLTKIITALVAIKYAHLSAVLTVDELGLYIDQEHFVCYLAYG